VKQKLNFESAILSSSSMLELLTLCKFPLDQKWKLNAEDAKDFKGFPKNDDDKIKSIQ
jgi:hypothetical protein